MRLSTLLHLARAKFQVTAAKSTTDPDITGIALLDGTTEQYRTDILYVGFADQLHTSIVPYNCILANDLHSSNIRNYNIQNLMLVERKYLFSLFNHLNGLLLSSGNSEAHDVLKSIADHEKNLTAVINTAASMLGNPLLVIDTDYRIIAYSTSIQIMDRLWHKNTQQGFCSYQFVLGVKQLLEQSSTVLSTYPSELTCSESPFRKFYSNVFLRSTLFGYILLIEENGAVTPQQMDILEMLSRMVSYTVSTYMPYLLQRESRYEKLIYNLVIGATSENIGEQCKGLRFPNRMSVVFMQPQKYLDQKYIKTVLMPEISAALPGAHATYHDNGIVCLLSDEAGKGEMLISLLHIGGETTRGMRLGVSNTFDQIGNLFQYYKQARRALELRENYGHSDICKYEDYQLLDLISTAGKFLPLVQYQHPVLSSIRKYDAENGTFLYDTLKIYLDCNCSIKDTAAAMFLHRNTVVYRLERLKELWNLDFENAQKKLMLQISFLIDKCTEHK